jgi:hypothetical protein
VGTVSPALEEDTADDQEAVDGQVDYEHDGNVQREEDDCADEAECAISDDEPLQQGYLSFWLDYDGGAVGYDFAHSGADFR